MPSNPTILWFRQDLRLDDNPALTAAIARGGPVVPVYILDEVGEGKWRLGAAARWWLHHSLHALDARLRERGSRLIVARGESAGVLREIATDAGARAVYWNRRYEPAAVRSEAVVEAALRASGLETIRFNASLLFDPGAITNQQGRPFQVFTPFWRHCLTREIEAPVAHCPKRIPSPAGWPRSEEIDALRLLPRIKWDEGLRAAWQPGEVAAQAQLKRFAGGERLEAYAEQRNFPAVAGTSRLSPHLRFGEIGPRQVWAAIRAIGADSGVFPPHNGARVFLSELGWREFAYQLLFHFPDTAEQPLRPEFAAFAWAEDPGGRKLCAWQRGRTGYPIVDAGMRELWTTGWMHNRVRMIVASFLVKHLRLSWTHGTAWFWDTLVDADLANNTLGWQWSAGCGADAAPYFRIFHPVLQGGKFDPEGEYVSRWVPELVKLPAKFIHEPWSAPETVLADAGVVLGETYPRPLVDHAAARAEALAALKQLRSAVP